MRHQPRAKLIAIRPIPPHARPLHSHGIGVATAYPETPDEELIEWTIVCAAEAREMARKLNQYADELDAELAAEPDVGTSHRD